MNEKLIGILAGMGPRSTAPFVDLIIDECQSQYGAKYDDEFPKMMIYSLPTPFYIDRPIKHELMKETIIDGLQKLESTGVNFIAMPCNSAHIYFKELKESINIPILNIVEETVKKLPTISQKVTLFSTSSTFESTIYQNGIIHNGHEFIFKDEWQIKLNNLIQNIKMDKENPHNIDIWNKLIEDVKNESIENIVIACTDLNVVLEKSYPSINIVDSSKCLAESVVNKYLKLVK
ncbi:TPA: amino acid racemase [Clostridioides difficile]|uniref:aspartate/glutamate racemase family protein n=1 Tax=Clostridioides difficile TaxID=1496 RepID=UPI00132F4BEF|nr:amino acid racemase [Clostridioides difficile]EGT4878411.1 amino acid racemase [Clostridioides difficile]MDL0188019.1 amino acid racemase [Clostridioides difficile]MDL0189268.1 amino acid racemase [Clostridioides difficile]MDN4814898.1 amino acid racemase [Clostridioides difficile]QHG00322.1 amino-acid racemase [Clostridioides difficile]